MLEPVFQMRAPSPTKSSIRNAYWSISAESLIELLHSQLDGLTDGQASERLAEFGANRLQTILPVQEPDHHDPDLRGHSFAVPPRHH